MNGVSTIPLSGDSRAATRPAGARAANEFVAGPENRLAAAAFHNVLSEHGGAFNPLVLYGPSGVGKSHLARGLANWWLRHAPTSQVVCLHGSEFAQDYAEAVDSDCVASWRDTLGGVDLLVLDDVDQLAGKRAAQHELCQTLDALAVSEAFVVVTARSLPQHATALVPALRSRLSGGLVAPLAYPGVAARRAIVDRLVESRQLNLTPRARRALADSLKGPAAALAGALRELELASRVSGEAVGESHVQGYVTGRAEIDPPTLRAIALATAKHFALKLADLKSARRRQSFVAARGVAMYLARRLTDQSLEQIGAYFGGRDHTTVLHGVRRAEALVASDAVTRQAIGELQRLLTNG